MKRFLCCVMAMVLAVTMFPVFSNAAAYGEEVVTEVFADGSYMTESVYRMQARRQWNCHRVEDEKLL